MISRQLHGVSMTTYDDLKRCYLGDLEWPLFLLGQALSTKPSKRLVAFHFPYFNFLESVYSHN